MNKFNHVLEITGKNWFDKVNGNSYCAVRIYFDGELIASLPFQYGYGNFYRQIAEQTIFDQNLIRGAKAWKKRNPYEGFYKFCEDKKIRLIDNKIDNCLKREVIDFGVAA